MDVTNLMLHAGKTNALGKYSTEIWKQDVKEVCACVHTGMCVCVLFAFRNCQGWQLQQIAFWIRHLGVEGLRQHSCIRPVCLFLSLYICDAIWKVRSSHAGVSRRRENIWLYRKRLLLCWHHQEFSISAPTKDHPLPLPFLWGKYNISFLKAPS